jgi:tRNA pseudouridine13 synthase
MKESPYPLEQTLGMWYYASDTPGIGGKLRTHPEDFRVEEVPARVGSEGSYLICRLTKTDWDLQRAVKEIAKQLGISHRRIGWTGTKDKHAVTSQLLSLYDVSAGEIERVRLKDVDLEPVGRSHQPLTFGSHQANRFLITIRDTAAPDLVDQVAAVSSVCARALPNYFGPQRFGVVRPITHLVGEFILKGDYKGAVDCYVGLAFPGESEEVRQARREFHEDGDPRAALHRFPVPLSFERAMLHHLSGNPGDFRGAILSLPPRLLSMFVSAFQSYLFNMTLSQRLGRGAALADPEVGDRLLFENGREDRVAPATRAAAALQVSRGRCRIALFMPGSNPVAPAGEDDRIMASLLEERGICPDHFARASSLLRTGYDGALRPVALSAEVGSAITGKDVLLSFTLNPGQYATTVCREFMKADPIHMI